MNRDWFEGWPGQYRRMLRWYDRLRGALSGEDANEIFDFIYAFFQNCYHLKDWLVSDGVATNAEVKALFDSSTELKLCRDLCNSTKHLQYNSPNIESKPRIWREWDALSKTSYGWYLYVDERRSVTERATKCVAIWDDFLNEKQPSSKISA